MRLFLILSLLVTSIAASWANPQSNAKADVAQQKNEEEARAKTGIYYRSKFAQFDDPLGYRAKNVLFTATWSKSINPNHHVVIGCELNGRELGCLPVLVELFKNFIDGNVGFSGRLTVLILNPETFLGILPEQNLAFAATHVGSKAFHVDRARQIKKIFEDSVDLYIELSHRESKVAKNYYSFPYDETTLEWARYLEASDSLVVPPSYNNEKQMTLSEFVRDQHRGAIAIRYNAFYRDNSSKSVKVATDQSLEMIRKALSAFTMGRITRKADIFNLTEGELKIKEFPKLKKFYRTVYVQTFLKPNMTLKEGLEEFSAIKKDEIIGSVDGDALKAPQDALILNPRYPKRDENGNAKEPLPRDLYELLEEVKLEELSN